MISFRYHLVSIIAVFLALALGIVVGTTALNGPITKDLRHQVDSLKSDRTTLTKQLKTMQGRANDAEAFAAAYSGQIVNGALANQNVLIIGLPGASGSVKDKVAKQIAAAGAKVTARLQVTGNYTDPKHAGDITGLATRGVQPIGLTYPNTDDAGVIGGALLSYVLLGKGEATDLKQVIAGFTALSMIKVEGGDNVEPAGHVVVIAGGKLPANDTGGKIQLDLISQLQQRGARVVVAGDAASATGGGVVALVRSDDADKSAVASVDNADSALGQVSTVFALADIGKPAPNTVVGHYGTARNATALFPNPAR